MNTLTLAQALDHWWAWKSSHTSEPTMDAYHRSIVRLSRAPIGEIPLNELGLLAVDAYFAEAAGYAGATKTKDLLVLKQVEDWAVARDLLERPALARYKRPRAWGKDVRRGLETGQALTVDQARALVREARRGPAWLPLAVQLGLLAGLRAGNVFPRGKPGLLPEHVNMAEGAWAIPGGLMKSGRPLACPVHPVLLSELRKAAGLLSMASASQTGVGAHVEPFIAVQDHRRAFKGALDRAGLGGLRFRFHDLRHTFATWLGAENPEAVVAALLGHTPTTVTSLYTQHVGPERLRRALDGLPELG
jgi:integrase